MNVTDMISSSGSMPSMLFSTSPTQISQNPFKTTTNDCFTGKVTEQVYDGVRIGQLFIKSLCFSSDRKHIISCNDSSDPNVYVWNAVTRDLISILRGHTDKVTSVAGSLCGRFIVSGSWDKTVIVWSAINFALIHVLRGHQDFITSVSISSNGKYVVSSSDYTVKIWETKYGEEIVCKYTTHTHTQEVSSVCFSPDGTFAVSGSHDRTLRIWSIDTHGFTTMKSSLPLTGHKDKVHSVAVSPNGKCIVSSCYDSTCCIWDVSTRTILYTFKRNKCNYSYIAFSSNGNDIIVALYCEIVIYKKIPILTWHRRKDYATFLSTLKQWKGEGENQTIKVFQCQQMQREICSFL